MGTYLTLSPWIRYLHPVRALRDMENVVLDSTDADQTLGVNEKHSSRSNSSWQCFNLALIPNTANPQWWIGRLLHKECRITTRVRIMYSILPTTAAIRDLFTNIVLVGTTLQCEWTRLWFCQYEHTIDTGAFFSLINDLQCHLECAVNQNGKRKARMREETHMALYGTTATCWQHTDTILHTKCALNGMVLPYLMYASSPHLLSKACSTML